mmetsp:Transcript_91956/g.265305  ORF Transcript_91956/g.265305 Transcript_91956/m.265305 type:complete len:577 (+) Transcript_91956:3-1733(+)
MQARMKAETFFKERGKKTEDALHQVGESVKALFGNAAGAADRRPWWGGGDAGHQAQEAATIAEAPRVAAPTSAPAEGRAGGQQRSQDVDDAAMRRHCAAMERLVEMGISPQAARVALRHLDAWIVGEEGSSAMAAAEDAAAAAGEAIIRIGDAVRLEGLQKNTAVNGMVGKALAYSAESIRWKVALSDGQIFWVQPKLLRPLELRRRPLPNSGDQATTRVFGGVGEASAAAALAAGWAGLEARQAAWKEEQETREIMLLEREEALRKLHQALEAEHHDVGDQAMSARTSVAPAPGSASTARTGGAEAAEGFVIAREVGQEPLRVEPSDGDAAMDASHHEEEPGEEDEMWDMDWTTMSRAAVAPSSGSTAPAAVSDAEDGRRLPPKASEVDKAPEAKDVPEAKEAPEAKATDAEAKELSVRFPEPQAGEAPEAKLSPRTDWSASSTGSCCAAGGSVASTATGAAGMLKAPAAARLGGGCSSGKSSSPESSRTSSPAAAAHASGDGLEMDPAERRRLAEKLEEKRRLADEHNGEDHLRAPTREFNKGRMPGVHPDVAQKLEERRRKLEMEEQVQTTSA